MSYNSELGRIPITIVEIDQDYCGETYGTGSCTAVIGVTGSIKCFNTFATCQDLINFDKQLITLRFAKPHSDLEFDEYIIPSVKGVSTSANKLNIGARSGTSKPLGQRAEVTVSLTDHPHSDNMVDPYLDSRNYDAFTRGTFWSKWLKRNPFYNGRSLRVLDGYKGESLAEMQTRHYVIESITLPDSNGNVKVKAQDILRLADDDKAQAPLLSNGDLLADIAETDTALIITGGVRSEYEQNGTKVVRLGDEIIRYTTLTVAVNGDITLNGLTRGSDDTIAEAHDAEDSVQGCLEYTAQRPDALAYDLLLNYGNIPSEFIDLSAWQTEATTWFGSIYGTRLLSKPIGVTTLLGELSEQFLFYIWWDELEQLINFKSVSPVFGNVPVITEETHLLQNKTSMKADDKLRVSEVWVSYLPRNPVEDTDDIDSYKRTLANIDATSASANEYGERKVYEVLSPWLNNATTVSLLSSRLLGRYRTNPVTIKFSLDAKDRGLNNSDVFDISFRSMVDVTGSPELVRYQIISKYETIAGEVIQYEAIKFDYAIGFNPGKWMALSSPVYSVATEEERFNGMWWSDSNGKFGNDDDGKVWS